MTDKPTRKRKAHDPEEKLAETEVEITRVRAREERKLITAAEKAGYFDVRLSKDQLSEMFRGTIEDLQPKPSTLSALENRKNRLTRLKRKDDGRRKALLGSFLVAQCRHKPDLHAAITDDLRTFLQDHPSDAVAERNIRLLESFLADPAAHGTGSGPNGDEHPTTGDDHRDRAHRLILLGAWVLERRATRADLAVLVTEELERFIDQGAHPDRHKDLLRDVLP